MWPAKWITGTNGKLCAQAIVFAAVTPIKLAGDNAAMIGAAGDIAYRHGKRGGLDLNANPGLEFDYLED